MKEGIGDCSFGVNHQVNKDGMRAAPGVRVGGWGKVREVMAGCEREK